MAGFEFESVGAEPARLRGRWVDAAVNGDCSAAWPDRPSAGGGAVEIDSGNRTLLLTGLPRSGTTLTCALLNQIPDVLALAEPIPLADVHNPSAALKTIGDFIRTTRERVLSEGRAPTLSRGWAGDNLAEPPRADGGLRAGIGEVRPLDVAKPLSPEFLLCIKHPALFTALANDLAPEFPIFALVRSPLAALASWQTLDFLPHHGRSVVAERMDPELAARLGRIDDRLDRQIELMDWYLAAFEQLPERRVIRYEDLVQAPASQLSLIVRHKVRRFNPASHPLREQAPEERYPGVDLAELARRLQPILPRIERFYPNYGETLAAAAKGRRASWRRSGIDGRNKTRIDFFIAGAQKGGTTATADYLGRHKAIRMANRKEVHYFDQDDRDWGADDYASYHGWFQPPVRSALVIGEATPIYLYWPGALERLHAYNKDAKLIFVLRHPSFRAYSHWRMESGRGREKLEFSRAIRSDGRARVSDTHKGAHRVHSYVERGLYGRQIRKLLELFPRRQCLFLRTDQMWIDPDTQLRTIQGFLGVEPIGLGGGFGRATFKRRYPPMSEPDRSDLDALFQDDIRETQVLTGLDLSDWLRPDYLEPMSEAETRNGGGPMKSLHGATGHLAN